MEIKNLKFEIWKFLVWNLKSEIWKFEVWDLKYEIWKKKWKFDNLKHEKNNQIDIIELHNVVKFKNWVYKIENKVFELEILKIENLKN